MTTYTFKPRGSAATVSWTDPSAWVGGVAPNAADAEVAIPAATSGGETYISTITLGGTIVVDSVTLAENRLIVSGTLSAAQAVTLSGGAEVSVSGALSAGSVVNGGLVDGRGTLVVAGGFANQTELVGSGLRVSAAAFDNLGDIDAEFNGLSLTVSSGGFKQLSDGVLTGGSLTADGGTLDLNLGGPITVDAAEITVNNGGRIDEEIGGSDVTLASTLSQVASNGTLTLLGGGFGYAFNLDDLAIDGLLSLGGIDLAADELTVDPGGRIEGTGTIELGRAIIDNGVVQAGAVSGSAANDEDNLFIDMPVTGSGVIDIHSAPVPAAPGAAVSALVSYDYASLRLGDLDTADIRFTGGPGNLVLEDPAGMIGTLAPRAGDSIRMLVGFAGAAATYVGQTGGGKLYVPSTSGTVVFSMVGNFDTASFKIVEEGVTTPHQTTDFFDIYVTGPTTTPSDFLGVNQSQVLLRNDNGALALGSVANNQLAYSALGDLGSDWTFVGAGNFLGSGQTDFLVRDAAGAVLLGQVQGGQATYALVAGLGSDWTFVGAGDYLDNGQAQFLVKDAAGDYVAGALVQGQDGAYQTAYAQIAALGPEWSVAGSGDYLGEGHDQLLVESTTGALAIADVQTQHQPGHQSLNTTYAQVGGLGSEWTVEETGDFLGNARDDILMRNAAGALAIGEVNGGQMTYAAVGALGSEWSFAGVGDYPGNSVASFLLRSDAGALVAGTVVSGQAQYVQLGAVGSDWGIPS